MRICTTVKAIAEAIARSHQPLSPSQEACVNVLRWMPLYKDLSLWEDEYGRPPSFEPDGTLDLLLDEVFEFGRYNLNCKFDPMGTKRLYTELSKRLRSAGIDCPAIDDF